MALIFLCPIRTCTEQNAGRCKVFDFYRSRVGFVLSFCKNVVVYFSITTSFYTDDVIGAQGWRGGAWGGSRGDSLNAPTQGVEKGGVAKSFWCSPACLGQSGTTRWRNVGVAFRLAAFLLSNTEIKLLGLLNLRLRRFCPHTFIQPPKKS